ncbi:MAG: FAD:protein FMN transferase [Candidatus Omnitrophota bacterium]
MIRKNSLIALLLFFFVLPGCAKSDVYKFTSLSMGTTLEVTICLDGIGIAAAKSAADESKARIEDINKMLSIFDKKSLISLVNDDASKKLRKLNPDLYLLIKRCNEYYVLTEGAFDVTVEPLVEAWGFGPGEKKKCDPDTIAGILKYVGMDKMVFDDADRAVYFKDPRMRIDFGGIAKGYAVDEVAKILKRRGVKSAVINMGGEVYCVGSSAARKGWSIGIRDPDDKKISLLG